MRRGVPEKKRGGIKTLPSQTPLKGDPTDQQSEMAGLPSGHALVVQACVLSFIGRLLSWVREGLRRPL